MTKKTRKTTGAITMINKGVADLLSSEVQEAVQAIARKHGVVIRPARGSYTNDQLTLKLVISVKDEGDNAVSDGKWGDAVAKADRAAFERDIHVHGLPPHALGATFEKGQQTFRVIGYNRSRPKYPMTILDVDTGRRYRCTANYVGQYISAGAP